MIVRNEFVNNFGITHSFHPDNAWGPFVNVYNEGTLAYLARRGAVRVTLPFELPATALRALAGAAGFIQLNALRLKLLAARKRRMG